MWWIAAAFARAPVTGDFDGDGTPETVVVKDEQLVVPPLAEVYCEEGSCELEVIDVAADQPGRELLVCHLGPRDERSCQLLLKRGGGWAEVRFPEAVGAPGRVTASGTGIVLGWYEDRWYPRLEKFTFGGGALAHVRQPLLSTTTERRPEPWTFAVDRVFPIYDQPQGKVVVANVAAGRTAALVVESADHLYRSGGDEAQRWFLVRTQSGLTGWATLASIISASDALRMRASAG
jgi:hypothetical protein